MLRDSVEIAAYGFAALVAVPYVLCLLARLFRCVGRSPLWRQCRAVILALLAAATIATIKAQKRTGTTGVPPVAGGTTGTTGVSPVANPITNTLYISAIAVSSNDTVTLTAAWPENFLTADQTLDVLGKENLHNETWTWLTNGVITTSATNISWTLENQSPSNHFYKVVVRESLTDMDDPDGDGLPNVYELARGRNPWVHDYALVQKLIVGTNDTYTTISTALAASTPYSVIEIAPGMYSGMGWSGVTLPEHPVLITGTGKRPVIRGDSFATFLLPSNSTEQTLLRNLSIDLGGRGGLRAGFWCGGNLPWSGQTASATFDNIYVRMPDSDAQYYGWIFYRSSTNRAVLSHCAVNAAGARDAVGVFAIDPSPISVENCTFANFPSNAPGYRGAALLLKSTVQNFGCVSNEVEVTVAGSVFDDSFTSALPLASFEEGTNFLVRMEDCVMPHAFESPYLPDYSSNLWVTNGQTAWSGHALVDSLVADLGLGALPILENDPSTDTDDDGLSDYEEVYERGTDPFLVDSDNDGVTDGDEKRDGTDPTDPHSFTQRLHVTATNTASTAYAVYIAWGGSERVWEANEQVMFPQGFGDTPYTNASPHGATHVKAFCDLNGNGAYDANADILLMRQIPTGSTARINFTFGDVDGDGVPDAQERVDGTDPYDAKNFRLVATVLFTDADVKERITNHVAFAQMAGTWASDRNLTWFTGRSYALSIDTNLTDGVLRVMCLRDFDGDGEYDSAHDILYEKEFDKSINGKSVAYSLGDYDHDGVLDSEEMADGTNPINPANYCFSLSARFTGIFSTTNQLSAEVFLGTNRMEGPVVMSERTWHYETGHLVSSNRETVTVYFWDDANLNGMRDVFETAITNRFSIMGHDMTVTNRLAYGAFDVDDDEMLDYWETQHGFSPTNVADAVFDADGDGFVNLYEFWAGTDPNDPLDDGYGTALYAICHGVDDRIAIATLAAIAKSNYVNFSRYQLPETLYVNPESWATGVDFSCTSVWNDSANYQYGDPATLLSPQHVLLAKHVRSPIGRCYTFQDTNGFRCVRTLIATQGIDRTDMEIGLLDNALPSTFVPARLLPVGYEQYLGSGTFLPVLHMDQERKSLVQEFPRLPSFDRRYTEIFCNRGHTSRRLEFYEALVGGDSGSPCFLLLGNQRVLIYAVQGHQSSNFYASAGYHTMRFGTEIQEIMDSLSSAGGFPLYILQTVDLSGYLLLEN